MPLNFLLSFIMLSILSVIHGLFTLHSLVGITFSFHTLMASYNSSHCCSAVSSPISSFIASYLFFTTTLYLVFMSSSFLSVISCLFGMMSFFDNSFQFKVDSCNYQDMITRTVCSRIC